MDSRRIWPMPKSAYCFAMTWSIGLLGSSIAAFGAEYRLTPELILERYLNASVDARELELLSRRADVALRAVDAKLGTMVNGQISQSWDKAESQMMQSPAPHSTTSTGLEGELIKSWSTGTRVSAGFSQQAAASSFSGQDTQDSFRSVLRASIEQDLWRNRFGRQFSAERAAASIGTALAELQNKDARERAASALLDIYWRAYGLQHASKRIELSISRLDELIGEIRRKQGFGLDELGQLERARADREAQVQRLSANRAVLEQLVAKVAILVKLPIPPLENVILPEVSDLGTAPQDLPLSQSADNQNGIPINVSNGFKSLATRAEEARLSQLETSRLSLEDAARPGLSVFGSVASTGFEQRSDGTPYGPASREMVEGSRPTVAVGLKLSMSVDNQPAHLALESNALEIQQARLALEKSIDDDRAQLTTLGLAARNALELAQSAKRIVELRRKASDELNRGFKQGRVPLDQVIFSMTSLLESEISRLEKEAEWFASRDKLRSHQNLLLAAYQIQQ
jgi:hypothetical protein